MKTALIQHSCTESKADNLNKTAQMIHEAAAKGARLICLQELQSTEYFCQEENADNFALAETIDGETVTKLTKLSKELRIVIVGGIFEEHMPGIYHNTAIVLDQGELAGTYRKMHIPHDPCFREKYYFRPGEQGFQPIETSLGRLGVLVCWDQWFPEAARAMTLNGAELLIYPTAIGWISDDPIDERPKYKNAWQTIQRAHAIANSLPVLSINRVGTEGEIEFWGGSFACDGYGEIITETSQSESIIYATIDLGACKNIRETWPFLRDRRTEYYQALSGE